MLDELQRHQIQHMRTNRSHDLAHHLTLHLLVAMRGALGTKRLLLTVPAQVQLSVGICQQFAAIVAQV